MLAWGPDGSALDSDRFPLGSNYLGMVGDRSPPLWLRFVTAHGGSMQPVLRDGDMIWVKFVDAVDVKAGDIVTLAVHSSHRRLVFCVQ